MIEVVPADTPRYDHDPVMLAPKGLLLEEAKTNTLLRSSDQSDASWIKTGVSIVTSPDYLIFATEMFSYLMTRKGLPVLKV